MQAVTENNYTVRFLPKVKGSAILFAFLEKDKGTIKFANILLTSSQATFVVGIDNAASKGILV